MGIATTLCLSLISAQALPFFNTSHHPPNERLQTGDIVFQDTGGAQGKAVSAATNSSFTHCGVIFEKAGKLYVFEAVQPVKIVTLETWKARSKVFHARRLKDRTRIKTPPLWPKPHNGHNSHLGKNYDFKFRWSDDSLYCSELVWKVYLRATGIQICKLKTFSDYDLENKAAYKLIIKRYGSSKNLPLNEPVVAPSDLAESVLLTEVPRRLKKKWFR